MIIALALATSCNWAPRVETIIHQSHEGTVAFRTISDPTFQADHPINLSPNLIQTMLRGVAAQDEPRLFQRLLTGKPEPAPLFSPKQIAFLAPLIADALSKATPEEEVFFHLNGLGDDGSYIEGAVLVHRPAIILRLKMPLALAKPSHLSESPTPLTMHTSTVHFSPQEALMDSARLHATEYLSEFGYQTLIINYETLDRSQLDDKAVSPDHQRLPPAVFRRTRKESKSPSSIETHGNRPGTREPFSLDRRSRERPNQQDPTVEKLKAEIEALKRALAEQQAVLEQLKGSEP